MSENRTMLGGQHWKIIRESKTFAGINKATQDGEDLFVSSELFDLLESQADKVKELEDIVFKREDEIRQLRGETGKI